MIYGLTLIPSHENVLKHYNLHVSLGDLTVNGLLVVIDTVSVDVWWVTYKKAVLYLNSETLGWTVSLAVLYHVLIWMLPISAFNGFHEVRQTILQGGKCHIKIALP